MAPTMDPETIEPALVVTVAGPVGLALELGLTPEEEYVPFPEPEPEDPDPPEESVEVLDATVRVEV